MTAVELQRALAEFIEDGAFARHVRRLLRVYRERRETLHSALDRELGDVLVRLPQLAGLHTSAHCLDRSLDAEAWARSGREAGVAVEALDGYYRRRPRPGLALGYGMIPASRIDEGISRLARCLARGRPLPPPPARCAAK